MSTIDRRHLFALAAGAIALPAAADARPLAEVLSSRRLRAGINPTLPPMGLFNERNQIDGFDADIAREIAKRMNVELEIVQVGSPDRIPFLQSDRIDIVLGSITRTVERALVIDYTVPLHTQSMVVLTKTTGTAVPINTPADLNNRAVRLVQVRGTVGVPWIQANAAQAQVTLLDNYPDCFRALAQGRAGWHELVTETPFKLGKPFVRQPRGDTRVTPEEQRLAEQRAAEIAKRRANFSTINN